MNKYFAIVSYLGEGYKGFEKQPHLKTIQGSIEKVLSLLEGKKTIIKAAGRTDAGVSALGQTFCWFSSKEWNLDKLIFSFNKLLPEDIHIGSIKKVNEDFDARHSSIGKTYRYNFSWGERDPFLKGRVTQLQRKEFDTQAFEQALNVFVGKHDFSNFTTKKEDTSNFVRTIESIDIDIDKNKYFGVVTFSGDHFMTYQIRLMMGAAFRCAYQKMKPDEVKEVLNIKPRKIFHYKAPAEGLCLMEVRYPK